MRSQRILSDEALKIARVQAWDEAHGDVAWSAWVTHQIFDYAVVLGPLRIPGDKAQDMLGSVRYRGTAAA